MASSARKATEVKGTDGQHRWIVDPLDGTTNFLHSIPLFAVAIALERNDEIVASVIYNPVMDELYTAEKGGGAWLNDRRRLRVAGRKHLADCVIVTGIKLARQRRRPAATAPARPRSRPPPPASAAPAPPRPTSPGSPPAASTATGKTSCRPGTSRRACCWCERPAAS